MDFFVGISQKRCCALLFASYQVALDFDFITGEVNFDHPINVVPIRLLHCKVTTLYSVINKYFVLSYFEEM